jgi:hypothetical protein
MGQVMQAGNEPGQVMQVSATGTGSDMGQVMNAGNAPGQVMQVPAYGTGNGTGMGNVMQPTSQVMSASAAGTSNDMSHFMHAGNTAGSVPASRSAMGQVMQGGNTPGHFQAGNGNFFGMPMENGLYDRNNDYSTNTNCPQPWNYYYNN